MTRKHVLVLAAAALAATPAEAYYQYVHYLGNNTPVYEKFDLAALPNKTVSFFVADAGPQSFAANDDFASVLNQVRQAAAAWNGVRSSDLRIAFGGLESADQPSNTPGGDVIFTDLAPGVLGMGGVTAADKPADSPNGPFFPVTRSTIMLSNDTSKGAGPSYLEGFFTTAVHEMGHALGLQHTWTSAAMSQDVIRNTSRTRPLDADDIAGLSVLYGKSDWAKSFGTVSGRVTANGQSVALASVVAIPAVGPAVSALTNPDGTYTIKGVPDSKYQLYVHPLPPDAFVADGSGLRLPLNQDGKSLQPFGSAFRAAFLQDGNGAPATLNVKAGGSLTGQDLSVSPQDSVPLYDVVTYSFKGSAYVTPAVVNTSSGLLTLVARANPPLVTPIPQAITFLGGFATATQCASFNNIVPPCFLPYGDPLAIAVYLPLPAFVGTGPRHLLFQLANNDFYLLPDAVNLVEKDPPAISNISSNDDGTVTVTGSNFGLDTNVFFDGQQAAVRKGFDGTRLKGSIIVSPPPGYAGQNASVLVYTGDGQNSTFYQPQNPPLYKYPDAGAPQFSVSVNALPASQSSRVDIYARNMQLVDGMVSLGFGTTDISVRHVWVLDPAHAVANVVAAPNAAVGVSEISLISGFQTAAQAGAFQIQQADASAPAITLPLMNADQYQHGFYPGAIVSMYGLNLASSADSVQLTLQDQPAHILYASANQINFAIPDSMPTGLATLKLNSGSANARPIAIEIGLTPPAITRVINASGQVIDKDHTVAPGDLLFVTIGGVDPALINHPEQIHVSIGGVDEKVLQLNSGAQTGALILVVKTTNTLTGSALPLTVSVDGLPESDPYPVTIQ